MTGSTKPCCPKRQYTLWVDGKLRTYDYPPEPPGYGERPMHIAALVQDWLAEQRVKSPVEAT